MSGRIMDGGGCYEVSIFYCFFFNDTATTEIYTLSLHDALPICSVIHEADATGIKAVVAQQFEVAKTVCKAGLVPIIEPEVDINSPTKAEAEDILHDEILTHLNALSSDEMVMLKLTIPTKAGLYIDLADHANVLRVVALSGGYSTDDACTRQIGRAHV